MPGEEVKRFNKSVRNGLWLITEPGNIETLAECCRLGHADENDVDNIYWLGRTCHAFFKTNERLREKLAKSREFTADLNVAVRTFNAAVARNGNEITEEVRYEAEILVEIILKHTEAERYRDKNLGFFQLIVSKFFNRK